VNGRYTDEDTSSSDVLNNDLHIRRDEYMKGPGQAMLVLIVCLRCKGMQHLPSPNQSTFRSDLWTYVI
jgi:hypothetical protein